MQDKLNEFEIKKLNIYKKIFNKISKAEKIIIISHRNPDGDTLGAATGLKRIIDSIKSNKKVDLFCIDSIPEKLSFIPLVNQYTNNFSLNYDLFIFVDIASIGQTSLFQEYPSLFEKNNFITISIDHHISNELFARQNLVLGNYPSATTIIYEIAKFLNLKIDSKSATSLLTGILTDTGNLVHGNTDKIALQYSGELIKLGADKDYIINNFFKKNTLSTIKTWGKIFSNSFLEKDILTSYITKKQLDLIGADYENIGGVIDYLNSTNGIKLTSLLYEKGENIKGSLRTLRNDVDVSKMAKKFDGGGHKKAAGFTIKGKIDIRKSLDFEKK